MSDRSDQPYVPADTNMAELTFKALFLGVIMAVVLGAANAYIGMKAGLTVAATFPAAVVAMAALRPLHGTILEENIARTTASVGEALVAGAIFTLPAFIIAGAWEELRYWESTADHARRRRARRALRDHAQTDPGRRGGSAVSGAVAASEIVKAGQGGQTGAKYVFGRWASPGCGSCSRTRTASRSCRSARRPLFQFGRSHDGGARRADRVYAAGCW